MTHMGVNWMKRLAGILFLFLASSMLLTACVDATYHVTINRDGSADVQYKMAMSAALVGLMSQGQQDPISELAEEAKKDGFSVTSLSENNMIGIRASKHLSPEELRRDPKGVMPTWKTIAGASETAPAFQVDKGFLYTTYRLKTTLDLRGMAAKPGDEFAGLANAMLGQVKMRFLLTLPIKPETHNASTASDEGRTLEWQLLPGRANDIEVSAKVLNWRNIVLVGVGLLAVGVGIVLWARRTRGARAQTPSPDEGPNAGQNS